MKLILVLALVVILAGLGFLVYVMRGPAIHGEPFRAASITPLAELLENPERFRDVDVRIEGRITRQCPSSGCWFVLDNGAGKQIRVSLSHLGRTFPQHIGNMAEVEGRLFQGETKIEIIGNGVRFK